MYVIRAWQYYENGKRLKKPILRDNLCLNSQVEADRNRIYNGTSQLRKPEVRITGNMFQVHLFYPTFICENVTMKLIGVEQGMFDPNTNEFLLFPQEFVCYGDLSCWHAHGGQQYDEEYKIIDRRQQIMVEDEEAKLIAKGLATVKVVKNRRNR